MSSLKTFSLAPQGPRAIMAFSGTETDCIETMVFGMRTGVDPAWAAEPVYLAGMLDVEAFRRANPDEKPDLLFFKAGASPGELLRLLRKNTAA